MKHHVLGVSLSALIVFSGFAQAQVLRVPTQHATIAAALSAATSGSVILVAAGTYKERLTWPSVDGIQLIAEEGFAKTTIDGELKGRVITFASNLTSKTVLQGFTITNGFLQTSANRNNGGGIYISRASPTIRKNRITGNVLDGIYWNYGGGVHVTGSGASPLITGNQIDNNEVRNGSWNYGAGIYVGSGATPKIVGNLVLKNKNSSPKLTGGNRGHGAGIYCAGSALIASNFILENINQTTGWNYGAGVLISSSSGPNTVLNNTIAGNACTGGSWCYGGGLHAYSSNNVTVVGNIVVKNSVSGGNWNYGGGLYRSSTTSTVVLDHNNVWGNTGGNYYNFTKGTNSIAKDPLFVSSSDYHLTKTSPCVDAIPATHLPLSVTTDVDGDPRRIDGDLDGGSGDGARLDMGGDEFTEVALRLSGTPKLLNLVTFKITSANLGMYMLALDLNTGGLFLEPWGHLLLGPTFMLLPGTVTPGSITVLVPNNNNLVGLTAYTQAIVFPLPVGTKGQFTNRLSITPY